MNEKFFGLSREKQDNMINAAVKIFALNGYERAGTDAMIKEAGISKGLLFHYFGSKLNLYEFVTEYCSRYLMVELSGGIGDKEKNVFERIRLVELSKLSMMRNYPYLDLFVTVMMGEESEEAGAFARQWSETIGEMYTELIYEKADPSLLKSGISLANVRDIVELCMAGHRLKCLGAGMEPRQISESFLPYIAVLKKAMCS